MPAAGFLHQSGAYDVPQERTIRHAQKFFSPPIALQDGAGILGTVADRACFTAPRGVPQQELHYRRFLSALLQDVAAAAPFQQARLHEDRLEKLQSGKFL
jgi:hypothetical protein